MIQEEPIIKISPEVDAKIKAIGNKTDRNEFQSYIVVNKSNIFKWNNILIPEQEVTSTTIDVPKVDGLNDYDRRFTQSLTEEQILIGTFHKHPIDGWSGTDDHDITNQAILNLNQGLPFIDIFWNGKTDGKYIGRMAINIQPTQKARDNHAITNKKQMTIIPITVEVDEYENEQEQTQYENFLTNLSINIEKIAKEKGLKTDKEELEEALKELITTPEKDYLKDFKIEEEITKIKPKHQKTIYDWDTKWNTKENKSTFNNEYCNIKYFDIKKRKILEIHIQDQTPEQTYTEEIILAISEGREIIKQHTKNDKTILKISYTDNIDRNEIQTTIEETQLQLAEEEEINNYNYPERYNNKKYYDYMM